jgi:hypothetical protein
MACVDGQASATAEATTPPKNFFNSFLDRGLHAQQPQMGCTQLQ